MCCFYDRSVQSEVTLKRIKVLTLPNASKTESKYSKTPKSRKNMPKPDKPTPISTVTLGNMWKRGLGGTQYSNETQYFSILPIIFCFLQM